jgi:hypothetical protein
MSRPVEEEEEHEYERKKKNSGELETFTLSLYCEESTAQVSDSHGWNKEDVRVCASACLRIMRARQRHRERREYARKKE